MKVTIDTERKELIFEEAVELADMMDFVSKHGYEGYSLVPLTTEVKVIEKQIQLQPNQTTPWRTEPIDNTNPYPWQPQVWYSLNGD